MMEARTRVMRVEPRPRLRVLRSLTAPITRGDRASPSAWMTRSCPARAVARISGRTAFTVAALTGPVPRKMRKMAMARLGDGEGLGPKKQTSAGGTARAALMAGTK